MFQYPKLINKYTNHVSTHTVYAFKINSSRISSTKIIKPKNDFNKRASNRFNMVTV